MCVKCIWRDEPCERDGINHGLCGRHYSAARHAGTLDTYDVNLLLGATCATCAEPIPPGMRAGAKYCSALCKERDRTAKARAAVVAGREAKGLRCQWCREPIPADGRATMFCSADHKDKHSNHARAAERREAVAATRGPCLFCGGPIPTSRRSSSKYCSADHKNKATGVPNDRRRARSRSYILPYLYGITDEDYARMLAEQGGRCAICGGEGTANSRIKRFHVDHDHKAGRVRGLLCQVHNQGLGYFQDDPALLRAAADYIERYQ